MPLSDCWRFSGSGLAPSYDTTRQVILSQQSGQALELLSIIPQLLQQEQQVRLIEPPPVPTTSRPPFHHRYPQHRRFGDLGYDNLALMADRHMATDFPPSRTTFRAAGGGEDMMGPEEQNDSDAHEPATTTVPAPAPVLLLIVAMKAQLMKSFDSLDLGPVKQFIGIEIAH
eukprot:gene20068-26786_t